MGAAEYAAACRLAADRRVELRVSRTPCGPTPGDPALEQAFNRPLGQVVVDEELVLATLLAFR